MKYIHIAFFALILSVFSFHSSYADDIMIFEDGNRTLFSGTITNERGDYITMVTNGREVSVDLDKIDLEGTERQMIKEGMRVLVGGHFKSNGRTLRARTILLLTSQAMEDKIEAQLIAENVFDRN
ncbi:MAG: hypothetical protein AAF228_12415 [Pseudomonadota bacterium]